MRSGALLLFLLSAFIVGEAQVNDPTGPNVCSYLDTFYYQTSYTAGYYYSTYYRYYCGGCQRCRGVRRNHAYKASYNTRAGVRQRFKCCQGWLLDNNNMCTIPICDPPCQNGGSCFGPGRCDCPLSFEGPRCQEAVCHVGTPCYPGGCDNNNKQLCKCPPGFDTKTCLTLKSPQQDPIVRKCNLEIINKDGKKIEFPNHLCLSSNTHKIDLFTNMTSLQKVDTFLETEYDPPMFTKPTYVHDANLGITDVKVTLLAFTKDKTTNKKVGMNTNFQQQNPQPCGSSSGFPKPLASCNFSSTSHPIVLSHGDGLEVAVTITNGGSRTLFNSTSNTTIPQSFKSLSLNFTMMLVVDHSAPAHCSDVTSATACPSPYLNIFRDPPTSLTPYRVSLGLMRGPLGWSDDVSGLHSWTYRVTGDDGDIVIAEGQEDLRSPGVTPVSFEGSPGAAYTVEGSVSDAAGNVKAFTAKYSYPPEPAAPPTVDAGAVAGVVIGVLVGVLIIIASVISFLHFREIKKFSIIDRLRGKRSTSSPPNFDDIRPHVPVANPSYANDLKSDVGPVGGNADALHVIGIIPLVAANKKAGFAYFFKAQKQEGPRQIDVILKSLKESATDGDAEVMEEKKRHLEAVQGHPNILKYYGTTIVEDHRGPTLVLEWCEESLDSWLKTLRPDDALTTVACGVADGMAHLHEHQINHNKLKASNVLLSTSTSNNGAPVPKIIGFGQAPGESALIPKRWMAPEVLERRDFSDKADVWSYAMVLTEVFSRGTRPWNDQGSSDQAEKLIRRRGTTVPRPEHCGEHMYQNVIVPATAFDPSARPSFPALIDVLTSFVPAYDFVSPGAHSDYYGAEGGRDDYYGPGQTGQAQPERPLSDPPGYYDTVEGSCASARNPYHGKSGSARNPHDSCKKAPLEKEMYDRAVRQ